MLNEENNRKIKGASALNSPSELANTWSTRINSSEYETCPDDLKKFIETTDLDELVYWKLKETLEKHASQKQNEILKGVIADVERPLFAIVLSKTNGNQSKAADLLGCNRNTLHRKLKEFLINPRDIKKTLKNKPAKKAFFSKTNSLTPNHAFKNMTLSDA